MQIRFRDPRAHRLTQPKKREFQQARVSWHVNMQIIPVAQKIVW